MCRRNLKKADINPPDNIAAPSAFSPTHISRAGAVIARSYDRYFTSGLYSSRYPRPNIRTLRLLQHLLPMGGRLLDYGAGEGRYGLALAHARRAQVVAVDISDMARAELARLAHAAGLEAQMKICGPDDALYRQEVAIRGEFDIVLFAFGVLAHIAGRERRIALLRSLRPALGAAGHLVLGLPNSRRRFRAEQAAMKGVAQPPDFEEGDLFYQRHSEDGSLDLFYHLFNRGEIFRDLAEAGYEIERLTSESILPETAVTRYASLGLLDDLACNIVPADWGYGYLVIARLAG